MASGKDVVLCDGLQGKLMNAFYAHSKPVNSVDIIQDKIVSAGEDRAIFIWSIDENCIS